MSENNENKRAEWTKKIFTVGTAECAIFFAAIAMVLALLFLALGFWQTILIALLICVGLFIGGVKDKKAWIGDKINRLFPPKHNVPYRTKNEEIERAVKAVKEMESQETAPEAPAAEEAPAEQDQE